ncbi:hypothetical protein C8J57DRAFT_1271816 [Mycena rebaudengoi]|nr:hypothetical protein C8J57DRAFT_1271816 [Mycena rebaudengoi]
MSIRSPRRAVDVAVRPLPVVLPLVEPLNVPRRRTVGTADGRDLTSNPDERGLSRSASASSLTRGTHQKSIRPLPRIPSISTFAPPRPLPSVPEPGVLISVTPSTPLPPPTPHRTGSRTHLFPPTARPPLPRFTSLSIQTSPDALKPRVPPHRPESPPPASESLPPSPIIPEPPSPDTALRRRITKLRRCLGESLILESCPDQGFRPAALVADLRSAAGAQGDYFPSQTAAAIKQLLLLEGDDDSDTSSDSEGYGDDEERRVSWLMSQGQALRGPPLKRLSRKWIREGQDGQRWVDENYANILRDLRAL